MGDNKWVDQLWQIFSDDNSFEDNEGSDDKRKEKTSEQKKDSTHLFIDSKSTLIVDENELNNPNNVIAEKSQKTIHQIGSEITRVRIGPEIVIDRPEVRRSSIEDLEDDEKSKARTSVNSSSIQSVPGAFNVRHHAEKSDMKNRERNGPEIVIDRPEDRTPLRRSGIEEVEDDEKSKARLSANRSSIQSVIGAHNLVHYSDNSVVKSVVTPTTSIKSFEREYFEKEYTGESFRERDRLVEKEIDPSLFTFFKKFCTSPSRNKKKKKLIALIFLFLTISAVVAVAVVYVTRTSSTTRSASKNVLPNPVERTIVFFHTYNLKGLNANGFSKDESAKAFVKNVLVQGIESNTIEEISIDKASFIKATETYSGTSFSFLTYEIIVNASSSVNDPSAIQAIIDSLASNGKLTSIAEKLDTSKQFGFWFATSTRAIYDVAITIEYLCNSTIDISKEEHIDDALQTTHEYLNDEGKQGFEDITVLNVQITSGECKNLTVPKQISRVEYIVTVAECTGSCPSGAIPKIDTVNRRKLVEPFKHSITSPTLDVLKKAFEEFTNIKILSAQTDFDRNGLIGCSGVSKCESFTKFWRVVRTFESDKYSGFSVDLSGDGNVLIIGNKDHNQARIFKANPIYREDENWTFNDNALQPGENAGYDVSITENGEIIAIGAYSHNNSRGLVRVYNFNSSSLEWNPKGMDLVGDNINDCLGILVDLANDGNTILVGADQFKFNFKENRRGYARVYDFQDENWIIRGNTLLGRTNSVRFGGKGSITENGNHICISGYETDHVSCYSWDNLIKNWQLRGSIIEGDKGAGLGSSVALSKQSGNTLVLGSFSELDPSTEPGEEHFIIATIDNKTIYVPTDDNILDSKWGTAHIYEFNSTEWNRVYTTSYGKHSGYSVDISRDGSTVAVGGNEFGAQVEVYQRTNDSWTKLGQSLLGTHRTSVSLSTGGKFLAVGLPYLNKFGLTTVYEWIP